jgi:hypothetical protein
MRMNSCLHDHSELFTEYKRRKEMECYEVEVSNQKLDAMDIVVDIFDCRYRYNKEERLSQNILIKQKVS